MMATCESCRREAESPSADSHLHVTCRHCHQEFCVGWE